jgi:hypothetical protein
MSPNPKNHENQSFGLLQSMKIGKSHSLRSRPMLSPFLIPLFAIFSKKKSKMIKKHALMFFL